MHRHVPGVQVSIVVRKYQYTPNQNSCNLLLFLDKDLSTEIQQKVTGVPLVMPHRVVLPV